MANSVRQLVATDFDDVAALFNELTGECIGQDWKAQYLKTLAFQDTHMLGAEAEGKIVAMATLHMLPNLGGSRPTYGLVENVVTLGAYQNRGFGRCVMQALLELAWASHAYKVMLLTGTDAGATGFYEKLGFSGVTKVGMQVRKIPTRNERNQVG